MDNQQNNVWIDRQEYERLKAIETQQALPQSLAPAIIAGGSVVDSVTQNSDVPVKSSIGLLTILTGVFAVVSFIFPPAILVFLGLGIANLVKFFRGKSSHGTKVGVGVALGVGITLLLIVAGPFLVLLAFMIFWQIGCWTGLGSCTTA